MINEVRAADNDISPIDGGDSGNRETGLAATAVGDQMRLVTPGPGIMVGCGSITVLIGNDDVSQALDVWGAIAHEPTIDAVIDVLARDGLGSMPRFVIAVAEGSQLRLIVRGKVRVEVGVTPNSGVPDPTDPHVMDGVAIRSWTETTIDEWQTCRMSLISGAADTDTGTDSAVSAYVVSGVAPASSVSWQRSATLSYASDRSFDRSAHQATVQATVQAADHAGLAVATPQPAKPEPATTQPVDEAESTENESTENGGDDPYADLFGRTMHRDVQGAAVGEPVVAGLDPSSPVPSRDDGVVEEPAADPAAGSTVVMDAVAVDAPSHALSDAGLGGDHQAEIHSSAPSNETRPLAQFKDSNTWEPPPGSQLGDHDGHTISVTELRRLTGRATVSPSREATSPQVGESAPGAMVQAVLCSGGHANPAYSSHCRQCDQPVGGATVMVSRPPLGRLHASTGEMVELDRPVIVGRNPSLTGRRLSEIPREWRIAGGDGLSRSHAMFHIDGWQVRVEDLGSVNATTVTLPGREPEMLRAGEPVLITDGAIVDLGGEVTCRYDATV